MAPEQERDSAVASDMKRIFGDETAMSPSPRPPMPARVRSGYTPPPQRESSGVALAGRAVALAIGIVVLVIGSVLITREVRSWFSSAPPTETQVASEEAGPAAVSRPPVAPYVPPAPLPAETQATRVVTDEAEPLLTESPDPGPPAGAGASPQPKATFTTRSSTSRAQTARAEATPRARATPRPAREAGREAARSSPAPANRCPPGSTSDDCIYGDVLAAHRRLEAAYNRARRAGLDYREIRDVRRDWDRARAISLDEPDETIRRYDSLSARLRRAMREEEQAGGPDPR